MPHASCCWKSPQETWFPIHLIHHQASPFPPREDHRKERDNRCWPSWSASRRALPGGLISSRKSHSTVSYTGTLRKCQLHSQHLQTPQSGIPRIPCEYSPGNAHRTALWTAAVTLDLSKETVAEAAGSLPGPLNWILNLTGEKAAYRCFHTYFDPTLKCSVTNRDRAKRQQCHTGSNLPPCFSLFIRKITSFHCFERRWISRLQNGKMTWL